jgi:type I restriction enzyme S subunit
MFRRINSNQSESRTLAALRDALLPKLLSGELRVPAGARLGAKA